MTRPEGPWAPLLRLSARPLADLAMRILVIRLSAIGDCIHALPVVNALRAQIPNAHLGWAIQDLPHTLLAGQSAVDRFHLYPRRAPGVFGHARALWSFRSELRQERYQIALDIQGLTKSGLVAWMSGAPLRVGFDGKDSRELNRLLINRRVAAASGAHVVDRNLGLLAAIGLDRPEIVEWRLPAAALDGGQGGPVAAHLENLEHRSYLVVNPGTTWATKRWPVDRFAELSSALAERTEHRVVVTWGDEAEERDADSIVAQCQHPRVVKAPPTSLGELQALIAEARLFVGNDTGPMHLAVALGVPVVALFGATDPKRNGPYGSASPPCRSIVLSAQRELECRPCWKGRCARGDLACLAELPTATVEVACLELLAGTEAGVDPKRARLPAEFWPRG